VNAINPLEEALCTKKSAKRDPMNYAMKIPWR